MLLKSCYRCGNLIPYGSAYCSTCAPIAEADREARRLERNRYYNNKRDPKYIRFYNGIAWRTLSARYTQDKGYKCEVCSKIGTEVHHKIPIQTAAGWELRLSYDNLELLCTRCHNNRHGRFKKSKTIVPKNKALR